MVIGIQRGNIFEFSNDKREYRSRDKTRLNRRIVFPLLLWILQIIICQWFHDKITELWNNWDANYMHGVVFKCVMLWFPGSSLTGPKTMAPPKVPQRTSQGYTLITREDALSHPRTTSPARAPHNNISPLNSPVSSSRLCQIIMCWIVFPEIISENNRIIVGGAHRNTQTRQAVPALPRAHIERHHSVGFVHNYLLLRVVSLPFLFTINW